MATPEEIEAQVYEDAESGVQSFSDGTNSVNMVDLEKRLAVARQARAADVAANNPNFGIRITQLRSPAGGFR